MLPVILGEHTSAAPVASTVGGGALVGLAGAAMFGAFRTRVSFSGPGAMGVRF